MTKLKLDLVCQVAVVVENLENGLEQFRNLLGIDEGSLSYSDSRDAYAEGRLQQVRYNGVEGTYRYLQYNFFLGGMDIEMFAPIPGLPPESNPITDFLKQHGPGIHHLNIRLANREEGVHFLRDDLGIQPLYDLYHLGRNCIYFDLRESLGVVLEFGQRVVGPRATMTEDEIQKLTAY